MRTFLQEVVFHFYAQLIENPRNYTFVVPSNRAAYFLRNEFLAFKDLHWVPEISTIGGFMEKRTKCLSPNTLYLLTQLYKHYNLVASPKIDFGSFLMWGPTLLNDFNDIMHFAPQHTKAFFENLIAIAKIERWKLESPQKDVSMAQKQLDFWNVLSRVFTRFNKTLLEEKKTYLGLGFYQLAQDLPEIISDLKRRDHQLVFVGFNALTNQQKEIIKTLCRENCAQTFWDADPYYLDDPMQEAGNQLRYWKSFYNERKQPFSFVKNHMQQGKDIRYGAAQNQVAMAQMVAHALALFQKTDQNLENTALILADESFLPVMLNVLPRSIKNINISMGYPMDNLPAYGFVSALGKLYISFDAKLGFHVRDLLCVVESPYFNQLMGDSKTLETFMGLVYKQHLKHIKLDFLKLHFPSLAHLLLQKTPILTTDFIDYVLFLVSKLAHHPKNNEIEKNTFLALYKDFQALKHHSDEISELNLQGLLGLMHTLGSQARLNFIGQPTKGLQVMGLLESRLLDFENVIIASAQEGVLPKKASSESYIPFDVRKAFGLSLPVDKENAFAYHFYRLIQRAKNVRLFYNAGEGLLSKGEPSRYILQMIEEMPENNKPKIIELENKGLPILNADLIIQKTSEIQEKLRELFLSGISASMLKTYLVDPLLFYQKYILNIKSEMPWQREIPANILGTIMHDVLFRLYNPLVKIRLTPSLMNDCMNKAESVVNEVFSLYLFDGADSAGFLQRQVILAYVLKWLRYDKQRSENKIIVIQALEQLYKASFSFDGEPLVFKGIVDRLESVDNVYHLIDYKSGRVSGNEVKTDKGLDVFKDQPSTNVGLQMLLYAYLFLQNHSHQEVSIMAVPLKNMSFTKAFTIDGQERLNLDLVLRAMPIINNILTEIKNVNLPFSKAN